MYLPRLRRINDALTEIKYADPRSSITRYMLLELIKGGELTYFKYGNSYVVNMDELFAFLKLKTKKKRGRPKKEK